MNLPRQMIVVVSVRPDNSERMHKHLEFHVIGFGLSTRVGGLACSGSLPLQPTIFSELLFSSKLHTNMKALQNLFKLGQNVKVFVPSTTAVNKAGDELQAVYIRKFMELMGAEFGGSTSYKAIGAWLSTTEGLVTENVTIVEAFATDDKFEHGLNQIISLSSKMKKAMGQEAIAIQVNGDLFLL